MKSEFYDGTKVMSLKDINGLDPELYLITTNRTGGKTTFYRRYSINRFKNKGLKFAELFRYNYEIDDIADSFFKDLKGLFFPNDVFTSKSRCKGVFHELFLNDVSCGYAIPLNSAESVKKKSALFSDVDHMVFDEFQSETNHYTSDEIKKFLSIHTSISRGQGQQKRHVPVYMLGNTVSLLNPYYTALGITNRLKSDTKFLKGDGFVVEQGFNESASLAQKESGISRAFAGNEYVGYSSECVYLNDNKMFIEAPEGTGRYLATLKYSGKEYGLREYAEQGVIYCNNKSDSTFPLRITVNTEDHNINYVMLKRNDIFLTNLRFYFEKGCFRFKDLQSKEAVLNALSY